IVRETENQLVDPPVSGTVRLDLKVVITTTAMTMTEDARRVRRVNCSPARKYPRKTATTGLTYAYVETLAVVVFVRSQTYDEKPIREPNTIRYTKETKDRNDTLPGRKPAHS